MEIVSMIATLPISGSLILSSPNSAKTMEDINKKNEEQIIVTYNVVIRGSKVESSQTVSFASLEKTEAVESGVDNFSNEEKLRENVSKDWERKQSYLRKNLPKEKFVGNFSAYTAAADECGKSDGITASGVKVKVDRTLACPPQYPFGTKIKVSGYGTYVCEDRGGAIKGNKFDIYMETKKEAFAFGRRYLEAEVKN